MSWTAADEQEFPRTTPVVRALIAINVGVAFLAATVIQPQALFAGFAFRQGPLADTWWTAFSYMFVHAGLLHLALNMYTLWLFGPRLEHSWGPRAFLLFYAWCGIGGAVFHAILGAGGMLVGASAAIFGVMLAYAMNWPRDEIYLLGVLPMRVSTLVALMTVASVAAGFYGAGHSTTGHFAHLGGFVFAFVYLKLPHHVTIDQVRQRVSPAPDVGDDISPRPSGRPSSRSRHRDEVDDIVAQSKAAVARRPARIEPASRPVRRDARTEELDRVLDKISRQGLASLTAGEKRILEEMSRELRDR